MQQRNYQREMDALIASLDARPRLLLHSCCGPCSSACLERLAPHFDIDVFFYNPNILPAEEWEKRLFWQKHLLETAPFGKNVGLIVPERDEMAFRLAAAGLEAEAEGGARCTECFVLRLSVHRGGRARGRIRLFRHDAHRLPAQERPAYQRHRRKARRRSRRFVAAVGFQKARWLPPQH